MERSIGEADKQYCQAVEGGKASAAQNRLNALIRTAKGLRIGIVGKVSQKILDEILKKARKT